MARSEPQKQTDTKQKPKGAQKRSSADDTQQQKAITDDAKIRSDWEGMAPRPDQASDDIAAPGHRPEQDTEDN